MIIFNKSGVAKQLNSDLTILNVIGNCLKSLKSIELVSAINLSSRTDAGVHALSNTMHLDLKFNDECFRSDGLCEYLKENLNECLVSKNHLIRYFDR